jgi:hypothetical protein
MLNRYLAGSGWAQAQVFAPVGTAGTLMRVPPSVAANASGQTLLLWGFDTETVASWL